jgi:hypothetical protein
MRTGPAVSAPLSRLRPAPHAAAELHRHRRQTDEICAQEERLVARHLRETQRDDVEEARLDDPKAVDVLHAKDILRFAIHFYGQASDFGHVLEEGLFLILLDEAAGNKISSYTQLHGVRRQML